MRTADFAQQKSVALNGLKVSLRRLLATLVQVNFLIFKNVLKTGDECFKKWKTDYLFFIITISFWFKFISQFCIKAKISQLHDFWVLQFIQIEYFFLTIYVYFSLWNLQINKGWKIVGLNPRELLLVILERLSGPDTTEVLEGDIVDLCGFNMVEYISTIMENRNTLNNAFQVLYVLSESSFQNN